MRCPSCGSKCSSNNTHCPRCAAPLDPRVAAFGGAARSVREAWGLDGRQETVVVPKRPVPRGLAVAIAVLSLVAVACIAVLLAQVFSQRPVERPLDAETFGNEALVAVLAPYDTDDNGRLSATEAAAVTELDCSGLGLTSLACLDLLVNLAVLDASENFLQSFDHVGLDRLTHVDLAGNAISELSFAGSSHLVALDVSNNQMTALHVKGCTALEALACAGNELARLDLNGCTALTELHCDEGQVVTLPLSAGFFADAGLRAALSAYDTDADGALTHSERAAITALVVDAPETTTLKGLELLPNLTELTVSNTALAVLDEADLPASLATLRAEGCQIESVVFTALPRLATLDLSGNPLTSLDVAECTRLTVLDVSGCSLAGTLVMGANARLEALDVTGNPQLVSVDVTATPLLQAENAVTCDQGCSVVVSVMTVEPIDPEADPATEGTEPTADQPEPGQEPAPESTEPVA